jgi:hypothetical protein
LLARPTIPCPLDALAQFGEVLPELRPVTGATSRIGAGGSAVHGSVSRIRTPLDSADRLPPVNPEASAPMQQCPMTAGRVASSSRKPQYYSPYSLSGTATSLFRGIYCGRGSSHVSQRATLLVAASDATSPDDPGKHSRNLRLGRLLAIGATRTINVTFTTAGTGTGFVGVSVTTSCANYGNNYNVVVP